MIAWKTCNTSYCLQNLTFLFLTGGHQLFRFDTFLYVLFRVNHMKDLLEVGLIYTADGRPEVVLHTILSTSYWRFFVCLSKVHIVVGIVPHTVGKRCKLPTRCRWKFHAKRGLRNPKMCVALLSDAPLAQHWDRYSFVTCGAFWLVSSIRFFSGYNKWDPKDFCRAS